MFFIKISDINSAQIALPCVIIAVHAVKLGKLLVMPTIKLIRPLRAEASSARDSYIRPPSEALQ